MEPKLILNHELTRKRKPRKHISCTDNEREQCLSILPPCPKSGWPVSPWQKPTGLDPWMRENRHRFAFSRDYIIANFRPYEGVRPGPDDPGIYVLGLKWDIGYVGKAESLCSRMWAHRMGDKLFTHYWCLTGIPREVIDDVEGYFIKLLEPPINRARGRSSEGLDGLATELKAQYKAMCGPIFPAPELE